MGIFDFLFGSEDKTKTNQAPTMTKEQQDLFNKILMPFLTGTNPTPSYKDARLTRDPMQSLSLAGLEEYMKSQMGGAGAELRGNAEGALNKTLTGGPADFNDFFQKTVYEPTMRTFEEDTLPAISRKFAPTGFYSSDRLRSDDLARRNVLEGLSKSRADVGYQAYYQDQANKLQAAGQVPGLETFLPQILAAGYQAGGQPRADLMAEQNNRIQQILAALGIPMFQNITTTQQGQSGLIPNFLNSVANVGGAKVGGKIF